MKYALISILFLLQLTHGRAAANALPFAEVADDVYLFVGVIEDLLPSRDGAVSNSVFIVGNDAVALVDTGSSLMQGERIKAAIRLVTDLPIKYVINTHVHPDHIFGNAAFNDGQTEFIAHERYPRELAAKGEYYLQRLREATWSSGTKLVSPTRVIKDEERLDLGGRTLRLLPLAKAHTNEDLIVIDELTATIIAGDIVFNKHCPAIDGSILGWMDVLDDLKRMDFALLIPGHGEALNHKDAVLAVEKMQNYFTKIVEAVRQAIADFADLATVSKALVQDERANWLLFDAFHSRNIISAYTELEWE